MPAEAPSWPTGLGRLVLAETDTTNAEAARRAAAGSGPVWIMAGFQTAGRGRRGRPWISPRGNFHATLLMQPAGGPAQAALRSFVASLALRDALAALIGDETGLALKWPNDVLLHGGKLSGILLEGVGHHHGRDHLAVGIGVNLIAAPAPTAVEPGAVPPVAVLAATGRRITPEDLLNHLAPAFAHWDGVLTGQGFAALRPAWLARAARLGQPIRARLPQVTHDGVFRGIDDNGALLLETATGLLTLPAADVHLPG